MVKKEIPILISLVVNILAISFCISVFSTKNRIVAEDNKKLERDKEIIYNLV